MKVSFHTIVSSLFHTIVSSEGSRKNFLTDQIDSHTVVSSKESKKRISVYSIDGIA